MKHLEVNGKLGHFVLNLPQSVDELSKEYLDNCTKHIHVAPNYALIAVVYVDKLNTLLTLMRKKTPTNVPIVPVAVRLNVNENMSFYKDIKLGDTVVVSASDLSIGNHISCPANKLTPSHVINICEGDKDVYKESLRHDNMICLVEFKLVPISAIKAYLDDNKVVNDTSYICQLTDNEEDAN